MKLIKDVETNKGKVDVEVYSRGGTKSDSLWIFIHNGKRLTPFAQRLYNYAVTFPGLFKISYGDMMKDLVYHSNPFLSLAKKNQDDGFQGYVPVPFPFPRA